MTTAEIRHDIIKKVFEIENDQILTQFLSLLDAYQPEQGSWWNQLPIAEKEKIEQASQSGASGEGKPYSQVRTEVRNWLESKESVKKGLINK
jgi:hypothetical protein